MGLLEDQDGESSDTERSAEVPKEGGSGGVGLRTSQESNRRHSNRVVGTPDYLPPEILLGQRHSFPVDWWAVGVVIFEMITGVPPFNDERPEQIFQNILNRDIPWPEVPLDMSQEAQDLIDRLLCPDPTLRPNIRQLKLHKFFLGINWDTLMDQPSPFVPRVQDPTDTSYFDTRKSIYGSNESDPPLPNAEEVMDIQNFSFKNLSSLSEKMLQLANSP
jgi:serine/threonine protein kinase